MGQKESNKHITFHIKCKDSSTLLLSITHSRWFAPDSPQEYIKQQMKLEDAKQKLKMGGVTLLTQIMAKNQKQ